MNEQFVTKKTADLAKQAGFDWETETYYNPAGKMGRSLSHNWNGLTGAYIDSSCPTQAVLQKWLRDVKHIQVWSEFHNRTVGDIKGGWIVCYGYFSPAVVDLDYEGGFPTYEAAIEEGLQRVLKHMVEIIKLNSKKK